MTINKPTKDFNEFLPTGFGGSKRDFDTVLKTNGYPINIKEVLAGDNLNYTLHNIGKQLKYLTTVVDYLVNEVPNNSVPFISGNTMTSAKIDDLLPVQSLSTEDKVLMSDGNNCLWASTSTRIGDPVFTLNFNYLPTDCVWLEGQDHPIPVEGDDLYELYTIYGNAYNQGNSNRFYLPDFRNKTIWGGTTAGYIEAGLPNIKGFVYGSSQISSTNFDNAWNPQTEGVRQNAFTVRGGGVKISNDGEKDNMYNFDASRCSDVYKNSINTVQPPAIKVRVYTRYK